jgi:hypothetical protein
VAELRSIALNFVTRAKTYDVAEVEDIAPKFGHPAALRIRIRGLFDAWIRDPK